MNKKVLGIGIAALLIDQIVKFIVENTLSLNTPITLIKDFFYLTRVHNIGAAWSILSGNQILLATVAFIAVLIIYFFLIKDRKMSTLEQMIYGCLMGGILGNMLDRIIRGYVVDFLDFYIFKYNFPIFNVADICIVVGISLIVILTIKEEFHGKNNS